MVKVTTLKYKITRLCFGPHPWMIQTFSAIKSTCRTKIIDQEGGRVGLESDFGNNFLVEYDNATKESGIRHQLQDG